MRRLGLLSQTDAGPPGVAGVEKVLKQLKVEQAQLEKKMSGLLALPRPTEAQNKLYIQLKASHTAVLDRQQALNCTLLELAEQVRQGHAMRHNMSHLSEVSSREPAAQSADETLEDEALEWAKADSLRESSAASATTHEAALEEAFERQLQQAAEESLHSAAAPPPHPDHEEVAEALRLSEWTAAEGARARAEAEAHYQQALRSAEEASRSEAQGDGEDDEELRRAFADSLRSSRVSRARMCNADLSRKREEEVALERAKADSLRESDAAEAAAEAETEELRRALQLSLAESDGFRPAGLQVVAGGSMPEANAMLRKGVLGEYTQQMHSAGEQPAE